MTDRYAGLPPKPSPFPASPYDAPEPWDDIANAFSEASVSAAEIQSIDAWSISYHGTQWRPGDDTGTELQMVLLGTLHSGQWFALEAWNDYTGWGCQDNADLWIGPTRDEAISLGLTQEGRAALKVEVSR